MKLALLVVGAAVLPGAWGVAVHWWVTRFWPPRWRRDWPEPAVPVHPDFLDYQI